MSKKMRNIAITMGSVLMVAAALAGTINGIQNIREHNAYAKATASELYQIGSDAIDNSRSALASFTTGVAHGNYAATSMAHKSFGNDYKKSHDYHEAGKAFQAKHHLSEEDVLEFVQHTAKIMKETSARSSATFSDGPASASEDSYAVWHVAMLKGIIDAANGKVQVDPRLSERIEQFLSEQPAAAQKQINDVVTKGKSLAEPLSSGNDRLWAGVTHSLREVPTEAYWTFRNPKLHRTQTVRIDTPGSKYVEAVDPETVDLNITVDPFSSPKLEKSTDIAQVTP